LRKHIPVKEPPVGEKDRDPAALEQRAYKMTNRLIETILQDPNFRKVIKEIIINKIA
jgi:hypothetical protein